MSPAGDSNLSIYIFYILGRIFTLLHYLNIFNLDGCSLCVHSRGAVNLIIEVDDKNVLNSGFYYIFLSDADGRKKAEKFSHLVLNSLNKTIYIDKDDY